MAVREEDNEKAALSRSLDSQRQHVLGILDGLADEDLRRPVLPSGWNCLGLVQHLALDVERFWFRDVFAGELTPEDASGEDGWHVSDDVQAATVLDRYRHEVEHANRIIDAAGLDTAPSNWPEDLWPNWRLPDLRTMMLHVITETACHAGHLDAARELIDGRTWLVLSD